MELIDYLMLRRDAFISKCNETEKGREYFDNAWRISQTKPERNKLREKFRGKEGENNGK